MTKGHTVKFKTTTKPATKTQARQALKMVEDKYGVTGTYGPWLTFETEDNVPRIIWEGGPFEWDFEVSCNMPEGSLPAGVWLEPVNSWSIRVFREVPTKAK